MFRRSVSLIVLFAFTVSQLATIPHAHAESDEPFDHDARPHVHLSWFEHVDHHHDDRHTHDHDSFHSQPAPSTVNIEHDDHDSDAVYLANDIGDSLPTKTVASAHNFDVITSLAIPMAPLATSAGEHLIVPFFSANCSPGRPLYLALRTLRI